MAEDKPFFLAQNSGLGVARPEDDLLHPEQNALVDDVSCTETQYFGFSVPEARIHGIGYLWHHPKLKTLTGGVYAWRGIKPNLMYSELTDVRCFMSDAAIANDLHEYRLVNGYGVRVVEALKHHHLTYTDASRNNHIDLHYEALQAPVMFGDGKHFEQPMRVTGELVLRGQRYEVNGYNVRDRSWGKPRSETHQPVPAYSWLTGVFSPEFSFNCGVFDQAAGNPELAGTRFALPLERTLSGGWVQRDGKLARIVKATKRVVRLPDMLLPTYLELDAIDELERPLHLRGSMIAANNWSITPNINFVVCLMRWECEGLVAYGDCQEGVWSDYVNAFSSHAR